jgi:hypothetical protein
MMKHRKYLSWENFLVTVLVKDQQRVHRISRSPLIEVFWDGHTKTVGLWVQNTGADVIPDSARRLTSVSIEAIERYGLPTLEIRTTSSLVNREFYLFANAIADRILETGQPADEAVAVELACFGTLFEQKRILSIERQIGLLGELLFLERILSVDGPDALEAWIGPQGEPHDFRIMNNEFEVKTSAGTRRIHTINNLAQLIPSPGSSLFIMSILLGAPGKDSGFSLAGKIESIDDSLQSSSTHQHQFKSALESLGYLPADHSHYERRFTLRQPLAVVPVDNKFPSITSEFLSTMLGKEAYRIDSLIYDVNIEGLESHEATSLFQSVFPYGTVS